MKRNYNIDLIKIIAAFFVVMVHQMNIIGTKSMPLSGKTSYITLFIYSIVLTCVPLFLVSTGALLNRRTFGREHYIKLIPFVMEAVLLAIAGYVLNALMSGSPVTGMGIAAASFTPQYYVVYYMGLYLLIPFINQNLNNLKGLVIILVIGVTGPSLVNNIGFVNISSFTPPLYPVLYYVLGVHLSKNRPEGAPKKNRFLIPFAIIMAATLSNMALETLYSQNGLYQVKMGTYWNFFIVVVTYCLAKILMGIPIEHPALRSSLVFLSKYTLGYYILGVMVSDAIVRRILPILQPIGSNLMFNVIRTPLHAILSIGISLILSIPIVWIARNLSKRLVQRLSR